VLLNLFIFIILLDFVSIVAKATKFELEYHISNQNFHTNIRKIILNFNYT